MVSKSLIGNGVGGLLVSLLEEYLLSIGIEDVVLLTATANNYFSRRGYHIISREQVPSGIRACSQFSGNICSSARCMVKQIKV